MEDCLCRLYDRNDGLFSGDVADLYLQSKRADSDCGVLPDSAGDAVTGGDRISNSESPIPGGGDDYTQSQGSEWRPNIEELKKRMEQSRLRKLRGDLDQLIESDPKLRALRPHLKIDLVQGRSTYSDHR